MIEKNFKYGDIIVTTSGRDALSMCIARGFGTAKFDHDITYEEAVEKHLQNLKHDFPGMFKDWTIEQMSETLSKNDDKYFLTIAGDVYTYRNHELADSFDKLYFENNIKLDILTALKSKYVTEHNIKPFKFEGDKWDEFRVYDDITEWVNEHLKEFE